MIRSVGMSAVLFILPFALYFLWLGFQRRKDAEVVIESRKHLPWVAAVGFVLGVLGFIYFTDFRGASPDEVYVPPAYKDGVLVPGHFAPRPQP